MLADAEAGVGGATVAALHDHARAGTLEAALRQVAQERYDDGY